jgi:hypothetical protein
MIRDTHDPLLKIQIPSLSRKSSLSGPATQDGSNSPSSSPAGAPSSGNSSSLLSALTGNAGGLPKSPKPPTPTGGQKSATGLASTTSKSAPAPTPGAAPTPAKASGPVSSASSGPIKTVVGPSAGAAGVVFISP